MASAGCLFAGPVISSSEYPLVLGTLQPHYPEKRTACNDIQTPVDDERLQSTTRVIA